MYILPQVLVYQDLEVVPAAVVEPLRACIIGPHFQLFRYSESDEKSTINLGQYDPTQDTCYAWPSRPAGGIVDQGWTSLYLDDAWLKYWSNTTPVYMPATGDPNRIKSDSVNFVGYSSYTLNAAFNGRNVKVGDGVRIRGGTNPSTSNPYDIETYVTGFEYETVASVIDSVSDDTDNQADTVASSSISQTSGVTNQVEGVEDGTSYDGLEDGYVAETYTVTVTSGGAPSVARLRVTSASGTDDAADVVPAAFGAATTIGSRGLEVTFDTTGVASSAPGETFEEDEFVVGQTWVVAVQQTFTGPVAAEGGSYTGPSDTSYVVEIVEGGDIDPDEDLAPKISVTTTTGIDFSGPHAVTSSGGTISIGNYGVTIAFTGSQMNTGDRYIIPVTAETNGAVRTLVLAHALPETLRTVEVAVDLFIRDDIVVPVDHPGITTEVNYTQSETQICIKDDMTVLHPEWSVGGSLADLTVYKGQMYVQYRALLQTYASYVTSITDSGDLPDQVDPDNPLAYALFKAVANANGQPVMFMAVPTNDFAGYQAAVNAMVGTEDIYGIVPLTQDKTIQDLIASHVTSMSTPENGRWRTAWFNSAATTVTPVVVSDDSTTYAVAGGDTLLATITDDTSTAGTQYTKVEIDSELFLTAGVKAGDKLRVNYGVDSLGATTYEEYTVDRVISEDVLFLLTGPDAAINVASKIEIHRNLTKDEVAADYASKSGAFGSRRLRHVWPDQITSGGEVVSGYFLCAALAGLRSGVNPHQGLTNVEISGFDSVPRTTEYFNGTQLNTMAEAGTWIVTQDRDTGQIYSRHQLTTGDYNDQNQREDSLTTNLDSISYYLLAQFEPYIGKANVTPVFVSRVETELTRALDELRIVYVDTLGAQVTDYEIVEVRQHSILRDRIVATVNLTLPFPFNNFELHLVI